ncbi:MAG: hypothetical protein QOE11_3062 [Solirubrobacteraceae bacterium]|jgi:hypothetical protein|nr:hypothetical protein [Solirubrobacteraceae bacterium]
MSVLRNLETKLADLVEGTFGRVFRSEVRPVELARKLAREMDEHKTVSVSRTYVPNEYVIWLSAQDRERLESVEGSLIEELSAYLLEHARREKLALLSRPEIEFKTDEDLSLGEFGIQTRLVRPADEPDPGEGASAEQAGHGNTMIYSTAGRIRGPVEEAQGTRPTRALLLAEGRRHVIPPGGAVVGRSRECDVVLSDANVSRRHAEIRPAAAGTWTIADMGSTNGVRINGRQISGAAVLDDGDRIVLGTAEIAFELE